MISHIQERYQFGPFRLDPAEHTLLRGDKVVALTPKAFQTLALLVRSSGHLVRKEELLESVWRDTIVEEGNPDGRSQLRIVRMNDGVHDCLADRDDRNRDRESWAIAVRPVNNKISIIKKFW